jgi:hypothetical protein
MVWSIAIIKFELLLQDESRRFLSSKKTVLVGNNSMNFKQKKSLLK